MATDFYPKDVIMQMKKNGVPLTEHDGVQSTGVLPNNDDTYQIRMSVQIPAADKETYECSVNHVALKEPVVVKWGKVLLIFNIPVLYVFSTNQLLVNQLWLSVVVKSDVSESVNRS